MRLVWLVRGAGGLFVKDALCSSGHLPLKGEVGLGGPLAS